MTDPNSVETGDFPTPKRPGDELTKRPAASVRVDFGARSHAGKVRSNNEDHFLVTRIGRSLDVIDTNLPEGELPAQIEESAYGMVVADGIGGMSSGEKASILAIRTGVRLVFDSPKWALRIDEQEANQLIERMKTYFFQVDQTLLEQAKGDRTLTGMGTTLTVAYSAGPHLFLIHVGDSRAYLFRGGRLEQLTRDHTIAQLLADVGYIEPGTVSSHATRHVLTNYMGGPKEGIVPEIVSLVLADGDRLLVCSDGLTEMVDDREIAEILRQNNEPKAAAHALVDRALERGGRNNVTVIVARYTIPT